MGNIAYKNRLLPKVAWLMPKWLDWCPSGLTDAQVAWLMPEVAWLLPEVAWLLPEVAWLLPEVAWIIAPVAY